MISFVGLIQNQIASTTVVGCQMCLNLGF